ncbi:hypothetical protein L6278_02170 [Candidatus Parcubacteria bacterium]|nr:hypothetical protein [Candidatus Parcubacteria bacterium]
MKKILVIFICIIFLFSVIPPAQADIFGLIDKQLDYFNDAAGLPKAPQGVGLIGIIINIINLVLSFLAIVFIIMILYGGFTYLTASGEAEKSKKALGIIKDSAIGVGIILVSGAIMNFVIVNIIDALK